MYMASSIDYYTLYSIYRYLGYHHRAPRATRDPPRRSDRRRDSATVFSLQEYGRKPEDGTEPSDYLETEMQ